VPEPIESWWARRQRSRGAEVPYAPGAYRDAWARYPVLVRQYRPENNRGLLLSQVPPAAEVWLTWLCDVGHVFVATPDEQRHRPGRERRRSSWCPTCAELASPRRLPAVPIDPAPKRPRADGPAAPAAPVVDAGERAALLRRVGAAAAGRAGGTAARAADGGPSRRPADGLASRAADGGSTRRTADGTPSRAADGGSTRRTADGAPTRRPADGTPSRRADDRPSRTAGDTTSTRPSPVTARARRAAPAPRRPSQLCGATPDLPVGEAFSSACAPPPASAVEQELRADLTAAITFTAGVNAVRIARPFFDHVEAWPDVLLPELRVAVEYDSTGRHGLEHVGHREEADRRKDRALRSAGWEVVRVRTGGLEALGPHDLVVSGLTKSTVPQLLDVFRAVRGDLYVDAWLR